MAAAEMAAGAARTCLHWRLARWTGEFTVAPPVAVSLTPQHPTVVWGGRRCRDLKRDLAPKLAKLEKRTKRAVAELVRTSSCVPCGRCSVACASLRDRFHPPRFGFRGAPFRRRRSGGIC